MRSLFNLYSIFLILISVVLFEYDIRNSTVLMLFLYGVQLLLFFCVFKNDCKRSIQYMRPFFILLLSCTIVNFQGIIDCSVMGYSNFFQEFNLEKYVSKCLYLAVIAQTSLTLGYINYRPNFNKSVKNVKLSHINRNLLSVLLILTFCLFTLFIDIKAFLIGDASKVNDGSVEREVGTISLYSEVLLTSLMIVYISTVSLRLRVSNEFSSLKNFLKAFGIPFWVIFILYLFLRLLSGDRGPVIYNLAILFFGYIYASGFRLSLKGTALLLAGGAFAVTLIGIARKQSTTLSFIDKVSAASTTFNESDKKSILPITSELAGSGKIAAIAINATEENGTIPYGYGKYEISTILFKIPLLSRLIITLNPQARLDKLSSSELFTREILGPHYTYGLGTSAIGESFLDFNILGPILVFFIFGMFYKTTDVCVINRKIVSPYIFTILLYMSGYAIYIGRSSFAFVLSGAIMTVIIQYLMGVISLKR